MKQRIASLVVQLVPGEKAFRLLPAGEFRSSDGSGRPADVPAWRTDADIAAALIARHQARQSRPVIDYEHQTLMAATNGKPAPASGWMTDLEWRDDGLYVVPDWTAAAAAMIDAREYRYISPVFSYDKTGRVLDIKHAALTNNPGLDGLTDLAALSALIPPMEDSMEKELMERLRYLLNLPLTTTPEEMAAELDKLKAMITGAGAASLTAYLETQTGQIAALKAATPDPAKYVSVATMQELQGQVAELSARLNGGEATRVIDTALAEGRLLPAQKSWAEELGKTNLAALKSYVAATPANPALAGMQSGGEKPEGAGTGTGLSDSQLAICKAMNIKPEDYKATLAAQAAA